MKNKEHITLAKLEQNLTVIEINLKQLMAHYQEFVITYLHWEYDDPKHTDMPTKTKLKTRFQEIIKNLGLYIQDINEQVRSADIINHKSIQSGSPSLGKVTESNLYKIDELLLKCNMYSYIIDEASENIRKILGLASKELN